MKESRVAVALGANLGPREETLERAVVLLGGQIGAVISRSQWHETAAVLPPERPNASEPPYLNGVVLLETGITPQEILIELQQIENRLGRDRARETRRWASRRIDLDLILMDDLVLETDRLVVPHPEMHRREFVLQPLSEVWPDWTHPVLGLSVREMLASLAQECSR